MTTRRHSICSHPARQFLADAQDRVGTSNRRGVGKASWEEEFRGGPFVSPRVRIRKVDVRNVSRNVSGVVKTVFWKRNRLFSLGKL